MPIARPTIAASAIGVLKQRLVPEIHLQPGGGLENTALALHLARFASRLQSATSSPKTTIRSSRRISSRRVRLI